MLQRQGTDDSGVGSLPHRLTEFRRQTFSALGVPNFRRYFVGQSISLIGTWMQTVAQGWLVLQLTGSGTAVGILVALQTVPILLLGPYAGLIADRVDKLRLMIWLQSVMGVLALVLGVLTLTGVVQLWHVFALAVLLGLNNAFENPARQTFVLEMVGPDELRNAVSLNSVLVNAARITGPAIAGLIIAFGSLWLCFLLNAVSFAAVVYSLRTLDRNALHSTERATREPGQVREGLRYIRRTPELAVPLLMMALVGCLAYEFQVVLPIVASVTFAGDARSYGFMTASMGVGAVVGGLWVAARGRVGSKSLIRTSLVFGVAFFAAAAAPTLMVEYLALAVLGGVSITFLAKGNSTLQLAADPAMRGRVLALWSVAFLGSTPIGGPLVGALSTAFGGRIGLAVGGASCLGAAVLGWALLRRPAPQPADAEVSTGPGVAASTAGQ